MSSDRGRNWLRENGDLFAFHRDERLMLAGEPPHDVLLVWDGLLKIVLPHVEGGQPVAGLSGHDDLLGETGVINDLPRSASVVALGPGHAWRLRAAAFRAGYAESDDVRQLVNETYRRRQEHADHRQLALGHEVPQRLRMMLLHWASRFGRTTSAGLEVRGLTQTDIASAISSSPKHVEATLRAMRESGVLRTGRRWYAIPDPDRFLG
ncbi:Crp/Fnr family transcriptional regulator [Saccharopolyspora sp. MS10]|uniref:Crp/Fnr family transcriptional regulator n=1 Tax=Saccharopolyspora sp. MS10 TaxID=3385973 RepID=UPI0039A00045